MINFCRNDDWWNGGDQRDMNEEKLGLPFGCSVNPKLSTVIQRDLVDLQTTIEQLCEDSSNGNVFNTLVWFTVLFFYYSIRPLFSEKKCPHVEQLVLSKVWPIL